MTHATRFAGIAALAIASLAITSVTSAQQDGTFPPGGPGSGAGEGRPQDGQRPNMRGGDPAQMVERLMGMDQNGDGKLSRDEMPPMLVERIFERADTNKDGFVERVELEVVAKEGGAMRGGARGAEGGPAAGGQAGGQAGGRGANMEGAMKQANGALRALKGSALDASTQKADLDAVQRLQMGLVGSKAGIASVPMSDAAKAKFGDDKAAYEKEFRKQILASIMTAFEIEQAILDGDASRAKAGLAKLEQTEETGHSLFQREEGGEKASGEKSGGEKSGAGKPAAGEGGAEGGDRPRGRGGRANRPAAPEGSN